MNLISAIPREMRLVEIDESQSFNVVSVCTKAAVREALETAAKEIERRHGNPMYQAAFRIAIRIIRSHKPD